MEQNLKAFWSSPATELLRQMETTPQGLTTGDANRRLARYGLNLLKPKKRSDALTLFVTQFSSPIVLILLFAAVLSVFLGDLTDALIIMFIVFVSGLLGFWQEKGAADAVEKLLAMVRVEATVLRDGNPTSLPVEQIVPGDIVVLSAGRGIPGDCLILESNDLFVDEAALTGETFPMDKAAGVVALDTPLGKRTNTLLIGTHVISGTAQALVVRTGKDTEFGKVSERLKLRPEETKFEHGVHKFGYFLMEVTFVMVTIVLAMNVYLARPVLESFLFALALAVGLTPQLLPAIISVNLSHGAKRMALRKVIMKRLVAIENFGSMNVLCSDKTGTLTEGVVQLHSATDIDGQDSDKTKLHAYLNAFFETGFSNPIDEAIRGNLQLDISAYKKLDEVPYDFIRKRLSILVEQDGRHLLITKGALENVLAVCSSVETSAGTVVDKASVQDRIQKRFEEFSAKGFRTLGVAYSDIGTETLIGNDHESDMVFLGLLIFFDPPKQGITETLNHLEQLGISLKIITGDNHLVTANVSQQVGLTNQRILRGSDLALISDEALLKRINDTDLFAEIEPNQKERIIIALRKAGNVVGYMGDGINDASALHSADVGISVNSAVDVAKEAADIVLLEKDLGVLAYGILEGRRTFANTIKYVLMATGANFGNMFSMAGASLFLSFLPLLPKQILSMNLMTDFPEMTIATDSVDDEWVELPRRWDIKFIRNFMLVFGPISSVFDFLTFGALLLFLKASPDQFRTGWFIESVVSASLIVLVIRTRKPFFKSLPGRYLLLATGAVVVITILLPFTIVGDALGFTPLPLSYLVAVGIIVALYVATAELAKRFFYRSSRTEQKPKLAKALSA